MAKQPIKVGIHQDLFALNLAEPPTKKIMRKAIACYVNTPNYLSTIIKGAKRIDLKGEPVGEVTAAEAAGALAKIEKQRKKAHALWQEKKLQRQAAKKRKAEQRVQAKSEKAKLNTKPLPKSLPEPLPGKVAEIQVELPKPAKFGKVLTLKKKTIVTEVIN